MVSLYATAKDARTISKTDMFFIEAQPFERNYTQSQQGRGGGGGGGGDDGNQQNQISQRQKEIITATWNQLKGTGARGTDAENAAFLSGVQSKLRDQAKSLAERMKSRASWMKPAIPSRASSTIWSRPWRPWARPPTS